MTPGRRTFLAGYYLGGAVAHLGTKSYKRGLILLAAAALAAIIPTIDEKPTPLTLRFDTHDRP